MKLRQSCVQDDCLQMVQDEWWPYNVANVCDFFCIWSMQACEFNNVLTMVQVAICSAATIFYFCTVFALYFFNDGIAHTATAQKGVRNSGDISVICSFLAL